MNSIDVIKKHSQNAESIITIGTFDGVHKGHELVFKFLRDTSNLIPIVITFNKSPREVINNNPNKSIYEAKTKESFIRDLGVKKVISLNFDESIKSLSAKEFIELLKKYLNLKTLVIGEDTTIGKDKIGKINGLDDVLLSFGCELKLIKIKKSNEQKISSSQIKKEILSGKFENANKNLTNKYFLEGIVVEGKKLGRELGYPTANLNFSDEIIIPMDGIYKTATIHEGNKFDSITSIGNNPTFNEKLKTIETYIINFDNNIYNQKLKIFFINFIRKQIKFDNEGDLINQMNKDLKEVMKDN